MGPPAAPTRAQDRCALPELYLITPQPGADDARFLQDLHASLAAHAPGALLVQFRAHGLEPEHWLALAGEVLRLCREHDARLLLGAAGLTRATPAQVMRSLRELGAHGLQLPSRMLREPAWCEACGADCAQLLLAASCHDAAQLQAAQALGATFATVSPVLPTASHPGAAGLGWEKLRELCQQTCLPVYALGGLDARDASRARAAGAVGIAAIRGLWLGNG
ncbi:thiamine phosphate synthase [Thiomonas sp.]|uniref:thiamine phosphate synthase n=1 Tax=Thiomonas sp. TaxID=2047785 RepID=UPI00260B2AA0|nr:thiamine phosphate synthase [Thiomonas sp.]